MTKENKTIDGEVIVQELCLITKQTGNVIKQLEALQKTGNVPEETVEQLSNVMITQIKLIQKLAPSIMEEVLKNNQ